MAIRDLEPEELDTFHPKFCDIHTGEYYCFIQYIHYTIRYLPRFIRIDVNYRC